MLSYFNVWIFTYLLSLYPTLYPLNPTKRYPLLDIFFQSYNTGTGGPRMSPRVFIPVYIVFSDPRQAQEALSKIQKDMLGMYNSAFAHVVYTGTNHEPNRIELHFDYQKTIFKSDLGHILDSLGAIRYEFTA